jgi:polyphenol oxidase
MPQSAKLNPIKSKAFEQTGINHAFFTREGGISEGIYRGLNGGLGSQDNAVHILENRRRMAQYFGLETKQLLSLYQIHSADVVIVDKTWADHARPHADAMVTNRPGLILAISTADCGPILFADKDARVIGAAHAGWKGALGGVLEATLNAMERLGAKRHRIMACIGPMISQSSYEVDAGFRDRFIAHSETNSNFFIAGEREGKFQFNLPAYIARRLTDASVGMVEDVKLCTYQDDARFYSFRRTTHQNETDYGRLISAINLDP